MRASQKAKDAKQDEQDLDSIFADVDDQEIDE